MSSGERAKPPATYEERNPFDISRRPQTEVAAEIAKRMAAWKQARGRSYATPGAAPSAEPSAGEATAPALGAPVQPRVPKFAERAGQEPQAAQQRQTEMPSPQRVPAAAPASHEARAPFFASFSVRRAMPPAPSLKQPSPRSRTVMEYAQPRASVDERAVVESEAAAPREAPGGGEQPHTASPSIGAAVAGTGNGDGGPVAAHQADERGSDTAPEPVPDAPLAKSATARPDSEHPSQARAATSTSTESESAAPATPAARTDADEIHRARARDVRARWIAAHDPDEVHGAESPPAGGGEHKKVPSPTLGIGRQDVDRATVEKPRTASAISPTEMLEGVPGGKKPLFDTRAVKARRVEAEAAASRAARVADESPLPAEPDIAPAIPPIQVLEELSGRREPTFDEPVEEARSKPAVTEARDEGAAAKPRGTSSAASAVEAPEAASVRREPTFDKPAGKTRKADTGLSAAPAAASASAKPTIELPVIETRIETRRIDALRADPQLAMHRPIFPQVEPETWDVPPRIATAAGRERHGTGWAIGLGAALLIIGITAPAAILQQGRQESLMDQDEVAVNPAPLPPQGQTNQPTTQEPVQSAAQSAAPERAPAAPQAQPASPLPAAPPDQAQDSQGSQVADLTAPTTKPRGGEAGPEKQAALGPVRDGGELNDAPVSTPPPPWKTAQVPLVNLASRDNTQSSNGSSELSPMVARPFVPDRAPKPFQPAPTTLPAPTTGSATVPINGASAAKSEGASIGLRPTLIPQLKPKAPAAKATAKVPQKVTRKPRPFSPQSFDQMFQTLVDTLSEGQPPNPATKPIPPTTRK